MIYDVITNLLGLLSNTPGAPQQTAVTTSESSSAPTTQPTGTLQSLLTVRWFLQRMSSLLLPLRSLIHSSHLKWSLNPDIDNTFPVSWFLYVSLLRIFVSFVLFVVFDPSRLNVLRPTFFNIESLGHTGISASGMLPACSTCFYLLDQALSWACLLLYLHSRSVHVSL